ncbi:hypothetical protein PACTADRAFT_86713 [Pachysolen tannophilus NRRL Y-2460]|uniref:Mitochondrial import inner membrane translocase subunit TIM23 n=1 Tax=Pachysolen tannophilus NRRL Y-2460 TaxID=669874 RepID=A0A1E4TPD4_PACTA|nr:hypothetical protein PACTADRAFT_86713 [Pachysolen tannophilus NRRL Y-2460]
MSWIFGGKKQDTQDQRQLENTKSLKETLGFDPSSINDVSNIISGSTGFDASKLHPLAGLDKGIEYLDLEDEQLSNMEGSQGLIPSRGWTDDLCYGTGAVYLLGLGTGGAYGLSEGLSKMPQNAPAKLKLNTVLNSITKRGPFLGNSAGVLALTYNLINSSIDGLRGKHDALNSITAGALAGALFKSSKGLRPMGISSALMAATAAVWCGLKSILS